MKIIYRCLEPPVNFRLLARVKQIWEKTFKSKFDFIDNIFMKKDQFSNEDFLFICQINNQIAATSRLSISRSNSRIGCIGEVMTLEEFRGHGLAKELCRKAISQFKNQGGTALFLGTNNPLAANLYKKLGWEFLSNSNAMIRLDKNSDINDFFGEAFE